MTGRYISEPMLEIEFLMGQPASYGKGRRAAGQKPTFGFLT